MRFVPVPGSPRLFRLGDVTPAQRQQLEARGTILQADDATPLFQASLPRLATVAPHGDWQLRTRRLSLSRCLVMGILNVTPDSFSDGGRFLDRDRALHQAELLVRDGADVLDIGGESTRPGHVPVDAEEEWRRLAPVLEALLPNLAVPISVDTRRAIVAKRALDLGVEIINDVSGLTMDQDLGAVVAEATAGYVGMLDGPVLSRDRDVMAFAREGLPALAARAEAVGIKRSAIVLDPGFGFAIRGRRNLELLRGLDELSLLGYPLLVGMSRKQFIGQLTETLPEQRLEGSLAAAALAAWQGAALVRVHDVAATRRALAVIDGVIRA